MILFTRTVIFKIYIYIITRNSNLHVYIYEIIYKKKRKKREWLEKQKRNISYASMCE